MSGTAVYEVRRIRDQREMSAALALRHEVFCVEQGVPEYEELDGRDRDGIAGEHRIAPRADAGFMRDEVGTWPHVRGAVGISTRGHDTGDAQIFVDLVDNPRLDHQYTVFAQVLNGIEVVDRILEGDVIDRVEIFP